MTAICVDDEPLVLQLTLSLFRDLPGFQEVEGFAGPLEALDWLENHTPDIALLAFQLHASGYLMKPINREKLASEVEYALSGRNRGKASNVFAKTFGNFDLLVDGRPLVFKRSKSKELLAYLVDRHGGNVSRPEAFAVLWEDTFYDRAMQKQMDVVIRSLRSTLEEAGVGEIFEIQSGWMRILPERMDSDLFRFLDGNREAIQEYRGEYMSAYSWASQTEAYLDRILQEQS